MGSLLNIGTWIQVKFVFKSIFKLTSSPWCLVMLFAVTELVDKNGDYIFSKKIYCGFFHVTIPTLRFLPNEISNGFHKLILKTHLVKNSNESLHKCKPSKINKSNFSNTITPIISKFLYDMSFLEFAESKKLWFWHRSPISSSNFSGILGNSEQKNILETIEQLIQFS